MSTPNAEQRSYWNDQAGPIWVAHQERLDEQIRPHGDLALTRLGARPGERIVDVGCGCGATALAIAGAVGPQGLVLGLDLSEPMLERARERAAAARLRNLELRVADAQTATLEEGRFDAVFSRFGVMFFAEPEAAFANLRRALRPGGRLVFVCWRPAAENAWVRVPMAAAAPLLSLPPPPPPDAPGPFAFGDADRLRRILEGAGLGAIRVEPAEVPMTPAGGNAEEASTLFLDVGPVGAALRQMGASPELREKVRVAVRASFEPHVRGGRVELESSVWLVQAERAL